MAKLDGNKCCRPQKIGNKYSTARSPSPSHAESNGRPLNFVVNVCFVCRICLGCFAWRILGEYAVL